MDPPNEPTDATNENEFDESLVDLLKQDFGTYGAIVAHVVSERKGKLDLFERVQSNDWNETDARGFMEEDVLVFYTSLLTIENKSEASLSTLQSFHKCSGETLREELVLARKSNYYPLVKAFVLESLNVEGIAASVGKVVGYYLSTLEIPRADEMNDLDLRYFLTQKLRKRAQKDFGKREKLLQAVRYMGDLCLVNTNDFLQDIIGGAVIFRVLNVNTRCNDQVEAAKTLNTLLLCNPPQYRSVANRLTDLSSLIATWSQKNADVKYLNREAIRLLMSMVVKDPSHDPTSLDRFKQWRGPTRYGGFEHRRKLETDGRILKRGWNKRKKENLATNLPEPLEPTFESLPPFPSRSS